jgi:hypothetical protein
MPDYQQLFACYPIPTQIWTDYIMYVCFSSDQESQRTNEILFDPTNSTTISYKNIQAQFKRCFKHAVEEMNNLETSHTRCTELFTRFHKILVDGLTNIPYPLNAPSRLHTAEVLVTNAWGEFESKGENHQGTIADLRRAAATTMLHSVPGAVPNFSINSAEDPYAECKAALEGIAKYL